MATARSLTAKTESVALLSRGAPGSQPLLREACEWELDAREPSVLGAPHFVARGEREVLHLFMSEAGWKIAPRVDSDVTFAIAPGVPAAHPNTVRQGEWLLPEPDGTWSPNAEFHVRVEGPNTEDAPFRIDEIGADFFLRVKTTKIVWFFDPVSGDVVHSGAKASGRRARPGKRYCAMCSQCFSANNFVSQHVKNMHTPPAPSAPSVAANGDGGVSLSWTADGCPSGAQPSAYAVQCSEDGGKTWQVAINNTGCADPRACIRALLPGSSYIFRVAIIGIATMGPYSRASPPFVAPLAGGSPPTSPELGGSLSNAPIDGALAELPPPTAMPRMRVLVPGDAPATGEAPQAGSAKGGGSAKLAAKLNASLSELSAPPAEHGLALTAPPTSPELPDHAPSMPAFDALDGATDEYGPSSPAAWQHAPTSFSSPPAWALSPRPAPPSLERNLSIALPAWTRTGPSLKRKASFLEAAAPLPPALVDFVDGEIERVLTESSAELMGGELVGDHVHLNLCIPVPKALAAATHQRAESPLLEHDEGDAAWDGWDFLAALPAKKRHMAAHGVAPSPQGEAALTPPASPPR